MLKFHENISPKNKVSFFYAKYIFSYFSYFLFLLFIYLFTNVNVT